MTTVKDWWAENVGTSQPAYKAPPRDPARIEWVSRLREDKTLKLDHFVGSVEFKRHRAERRMTMLALAAAQLAIAIIVGDVMGKSTALPGGVWLVMVVVSWWGLMMYLKMRAKDAARDHTHRATVHGLAENARRDMRDYEDRMNNG